MFLILLTINHLSSEPSTFKQANVFSQWMNAMCAEYDAHMATNTWRLVPRPSRANVFGNKRVYRTKRKPDGTIEHNKACLIAKGFHK